MKNGYQQHFKKMKLNNTSLPPKSGKQFFIKSDAKKPEMRVTKKRKKDLPLGSVIGAFIILACAGVGYSYAESIEDFLGKVEISLLGQVSAQTEEKKIPPTTDKKANPASAKSPETKATTPSSSTMTPEEMALFKSLDERKKQLDLREQELKKLEAELHKQKEELEKRLAGLEELRSKIGNQLQERVNADAEKVDKLVSFYSSMKAQKAAKVFETMNEDLAVEILQKMKKQSAAEIMNLMEAEKARKLSEKFAGYRKN